MITNALHCIELYDWTAGAGGAVGQEAAGEAVAREAEEDDERVQREQESSIHAVSSRLFFLFICATH